MWSSQGSILGPLLFLLSINDISNISSIIDIILFADNTNIFFSDKYLTTLESRVNTEIQKIFRWLKLINSLNIKKTNYIIFKSKQKLINFKLNIKLDNIEIEQVSFTKFLGVIINENLTWENHIKVVKIKISKSMGILAKIKSNVPCVILRNLYFMLL